MYSVLQLHMGESFCHTVIGVTHCTEQYSTAQLSYDLLMNNDARTWAGVPISAQSPTISHFPPCSSTYWSELLPEWASGQEPQLPTSCLGCDPCWQQQHICVSTYLTAIVTLPNQGFNWWLLWVLASPYLITTCCGLFWIKVLTLPWVYTICFFHVKWCCMDALC